MKKALTRNTEKKCWYFVNGKKIDGVPSDLRGDVSDLLGDVSGLRGDVGECEITDEERKGGVNVSNLI